MTEELDLSAILLADTEPRGYPPSHPAMMVALRLYACSRGRCSSRQIARACEERLDFQAVTALNRPDFRTISAFRRRHLMALADLFGQVALDGTKLRASASKPQAMRYARMCQAEPELAAAVRHWLDQADAAAAAEDAALGSGRRGDEMPAGMRDKQRRLARIRAIHAEREAEAKAAAAAKPDPGSRPDGSPGRRRGRKPKQPPGEPRPAAQRHFTAPERRIMQGRDGFIHAYNAQAAVDRSAQIILAHRLTTTASEQDALVPLLDAVRANTGRMPAEVSADSGFCSEANLTTLAERDIRGYVAPGRARHPDGEAQWRGPLGSAMRRKLRRAGRRSRYRLRRRFGV